ncbi:amidohydrolase family protein [Stenotrophomonas rhizophila]|uniref:Amidohydrolase family protein n=2 Tax=Stenotrophomonas rhizophila TaxID=216778 RepID=A0A7V8CDQ3_9GAMM|nr:amidohydrolase family protein [Stenotrophomonas rhizophila]KAB7630904.1 amidohydrolase family protein [Stenotrophomonas rhizophila]
MSRRVAMRLLPQALLLLAGACIAPALFAQDLLIRNATVHTAAARGSLEHSDVLIQGGVIRAVGPGLSAPAGVAVVEAAGKPLTPALFGGITDIGIEEVSGESATVDSTLKLEDQPLRPEFDVTLAFNPDSVLIPVARLDGIGFTLLGANTGGGFIAGQGGVMRLDGSADPVGPQALFIRLGASGAELTGTSRAGQWMLLEQMVSEARGRVPADSPHALLTPAGRATLARYLAGHGRIVVQVDRAADIRQLLRWAAREKVKIAIAGGAEAWRLAPQLAQAGVPVFVDGLGNLPSSFDQLGATLQNAARLNAAGVPVSFAQRDDASHNARKMRQLAGNAVANGLPWEDGLAGLTRVPAQALGVGDRLGTIEPGKLADLVLWEGDPLDVGHYAEQVWLGGRAMPMRSRQTELRDRYQAPASSEPRAYSR